MTMMASMTISCTGMANYNAYMQFNGGQGGPLENQNAAQTISITVTCDYATMTWVYSAVVNGITYNRDITSVACQEAPNG